MIRIFTSKHVEAFYENKIVVNFCIKLVHLLTYIRYLYYYINIQVL